ncbi:ribonuclease H-like domain-containing protein [Tanacetum coccineum]
MHQLLRFRDPAHPDYVCLLQRSLNGLKEASQAWFQRFTAYITRVMFSHGRCDSSLVIYQQGTGTAYLLLYVDDIRKSATEILERAHMVGCNSSQTPVDTESKLGDDGDPVCLYMHDPREPHFSTLKRILRCGLGWLPYYSEVYFWLLCISWQQLTLMLRNLLRELYTPLSSATLVYYDNVNAVYISSNPVQHQRTKHKEIDIHFVRDLVAVGQVRVLHVTYRCQYAYIFTKGLSSALFEGFHSRLSVRCPSAPTARDC